MDKIDLFKSRNHEWLSNIDILEQLREIGADTAEILYIHTGLSFGLPNPKLKRNELLQLLFEVLQSLKVPVICFPTYTFSFCNEQDYDVAHSPSKMGALNEYIRKQPGTVRSIDPLMSVILVGEDHSLVKDLEHNSIGKGSTFDKLHQRDQVKFLFFGTNLGDCFTYMHYIEWLEHVPYRYNREFSGTIINGEKVYGDTYTLFVRYHGVKPNEGSYRYQEILADRGALKIKACGDSYISCIDKTTAYHIYLELLNQDSFYFIEKPFLANSLSTEFKVNHMVSL